MCVERKSINDLIGSLKSGRLYNQTEAMCIHYAIPILLIEFDPGKSFSFSMIRDDTISNVGTSQKLVLLLIHFPKLRIVWSPTPNFTVDIFEALKVFLCHIYRRVSKMSQIWKQHFQWEWKVWVLKTQISISLR